MKMEDIRFLAELMRDTGLTALELKDDDATLKLERQEPAAPVVAPAPAPVVVSTAPVMAPAAAPAAAPAPAAPAAEPAQEEEPQGGIEIKSPMVGVFYAAAEPGAAPFVSVGDKVGKGDVLCIIEAMKLMNEITAERDGVVTQVCCGNGQMVEYGQTLFRLEEG